MCSYLHSIAFSMELKLFGRPLRKLCITDKPSSAVPKMDDNSSYCISFLKNYSYNATIRTSSTQRKRQI